MTESPQPRPPSPRGAAPAPPVGGLRREAPPAPRRRGAPQRQMNASADTRALAARARLRGSRSGEACLWLDAFVQAHACSVTRRGPEIDTFIRRTAESSCARMAEVARWHGLAAATSRGGGGKILSEEEKRELEERRAMAKEDKRAASRTGHPPEKRDWYAVAGARRKIIPLWRTASSPKYVTRGARRAACSLG